MRGINCVFNPKLCNILYTSEALFWPIESAVFKVSKSTTWVQCRLIQLPGISDFYNHSTISWHGMTLHVDLCATQICSEVKVCSDYTQRETDSVRLRSAVRRYLLDVNRTVENVHTNTQLKIKPAELVAAPTTTGKHYMWAWELYPICEAW